MSAGWYGALVFCLILALGSGCRMRDRVPPAPGLKPVDQDAAVDYRGDGSVEGGAGTVAGSGGSAGGAAGSGGTAGDAAPIIVSPFDPVERHVATSCDDFSTGTVHLIGEGSGNQVVQEISLDDDDAQRQPCGVLPPVVGPRYVFPTAARHANRPWIRQTDGKMLYLHQGNVRQFVPDPEGSTTDPIANDPIVSVNNSCGPNPTAGHGPFSRMRLKPNGRVVFGCAADSSPNENIYDDAGAIIGNWGHGSPFDLVDNSGVFLVPRFGHIYAEKAWLYTYTRGNDGIALRPIDRDADCYEESQIIAVRALASGFWVVLTNSCGLQLWQTIDTKIRIIAYYVHDPNFKYQANRPGFGNLAADGTLYYKQICWTNIDCLPCDGAEFCAVKPQQAPSKEVVGYPALGASGLSNAQLLETWSELPELSATQ